MPAILERSTLLRHTLFALVGLGLLVALTYSFGDFRNSTQLSPIAYTLCAAAGLTLLVGQSGQISLGHGAFMAVGAYTFALIQGAWSTSHPNLQLIGLLAAAVVVAALFGAVVGVAAARLRGPYLAGATLALALGLPSLASYEKLSDHLGGNNGLLVSAPNPPSGMNPNRWQAIVCCICVVIVLWFLANISRSRLGRSFRAVRDDEIAASLCGLSVAQVQVVAFIVSAACAGLGGALLAIINLTAGPGAFPLSLSLGLLAAVVFGGLGSLAGAVYGSILVVLLPTWSQDLTDALSIHSNKVSNNMPLMVYGVVLAVAMLAAPYGVQGALKRLGSLFKRLATPTEDT
jgi:branched-chain amino acid transport system permease protein